MIVNKTIKYLNGIFQSFTKIDPQVKIPCIRPAYNLRSYKKGFKKFSVPCLLKKLNNLISQLKVNFKMAIE